MSTLPLAPYLSYWHARRPPFLSAVEPAEMYMPERLAGSLERLLSFCAQDQQLALITGDPGTGKSTLLRWLHSRLPTTSHELLLMAVVQRETAPGWLTPRLAEFLGVDPSKLDAAAAAAARGDLGMLLRLTAQRLDDLISEGRKLVVAIDAAHLLSSNTAFDEVAGFLNLQALSSSCLAFVLCGHPRLEDSLRGNPELATRLSFHLRLRRFDTAESHGYIRHRLATAKLDATIDSEALDFLHLRSRGVAASLDAHAEACLVEAYVRRTRRITVSLAQDAARGIGLSEVSDFLLSPPPNLAAAKGGGEADLSAPQMHAPLPPRPVESTSGIQDGGPASSSANKVKTPAAASITLASLLKSENKT